MSTDGAIPVEREGLRNARRVVVKVGTAVVSNSDGTLALSRLGALVEQLQDLKEEGRQVLLVSSGAVGLGRLKLGLSKELVQNTANVTDRQACAAAGQEVLMSTYGLMFQRMGTTCAQVLITESDLLSRERYTYLTGTLERLMELKAIPIINENDVVTGGPTVKERVFTDNDRLSALLASGADADGLALLTDVDAVFTKPPDQPGAERIRVYKPDASVQIGEKSTMGRGGMASKIAAARVAALGGVHTCVAGGFDIGNIKKVFSGEDIGTLFPASGRPNKRQRWLTFATHAKGVLTVTDACKKRMIDSDGQDGGYQLNISDLIETKGEYGERAVVEIKGQEGGVFARGQVQMSSEEIKEKIAPMGVDGMPVITFNSSHKVMQDSECVILATI
jgi:glutamate 5-kinase